MSLALAVCLFLRKQYWPRCCVVRLNSPIAWTKRLRVYHRWHRSDFAKFIIDTYQLTIRTSGLNEKRLEQISISGVRYLLILCVSASFTVDPACTALWLTCVITKISIHFSSQYSDFPCHLLPSSRWSRRALLKVSFKAAYLECLPAVTLHDW